MIGHFLLTLTPEEEDRVLTQPMRKAIRQRIWTNRAARALRTQEVHV